MYASISVGIDVAKAHPDVHRLPDTKRLRVSNDSAGHTRLLAFVTSARPERVVLVSELPELGTLHRSKPAALVGVAPYDNQSGQSEFKRSIRGGKAHRPRRALHGNAGGHPAG